MKLEELYDKRLLEETYRIMNKVWMPAHMGQLAEDSRRLKTMTYRSKDEKQQERIKKAMHSIAEGCDNDYLHRQLAEECIELAQAALKMIRVHNNETPAGEGEVKDALLEEFADVCIMLDLFETAVLGPVSNAKVTKIYHEKLNRFRSRVLPL